MALIARLIRRVITAMGQPCPKCGGTNTSCENGIWACGYCGHEW